MIEKFIGINRKFILKYISDDIFKKNQILYKVQCIETEISANDSFAELQRNANNAKQCVENCSALRI